MALSQGNSTVSAVAKRQLNLQALLFTTYINLAYNAQAPTNIVIGDIIVNIDIGKFWPLSSLSSVNTNTFSSRVHRRLQLMRRRHDNLHHNLDSFHHRLRRPN